MLVSGCARAGKPCISFAMESASGFYDATVAFAFENQGLLLGLAVAVLVVTATQLAAGASSSLPTGTLTEEYKPYPLIARTEVSHNTRLFRFALPSPDARVGLPLGRHMSVRAYVGGEETRRPYTPTSSDADLGYFELLIKVYPAPHGKMSRHLDSLAVGDTVDVRGPLGKFTYTKNSYSMICMICGGTGITPMWQVFREILADADDTTKLSLIFANVKEDDILLRDELDQMAASEPDLSVYYVLNEAPPGWKGGVGFISQEMIAEQFGNASNDKLVMLCGPPPMTKAMKSHLASLGFSEKNQFKF
jgi:cytochrome-b5 reductase